MDQIVSAVIKGPQGHIISEKAVNVHGITNGDCCEGQELSEALRPIIDLLKQGAEICCHNLRHETYKKQRRHLKSGLYT